MSTSPLSTDLIPTDEPPPDTDTFTSLFSAMNCSAAVSAIGKTVDEPFIVIFDVSVCSVQP